MEQERNPNKNAELSMEQNYNQIDGIINNLPAPPPEEKPLDKVREHPPQADEFCERYRSVAMLINQRY